MVPIRNKNHNLCLSLPLKSVIWSLFNSTKKESHCFELYCRFDYIKCNLRTVYFKWYFHCPSATPPTPTPKVLLCQKHALEIFSCTIQEEETADRWSCWGAGPAWWGSHPASPVPCWCGCSDWCYLCRMSRLLWSRSCCSVGDQSKQTKLAPSL